MNIYLADLQESDFYPLALTRPIAELRAGILTLAQKWEKITGNQPSPLCRAALRDKYPPLYDVPDNLVIDARLIPDSAIWRELTQLNPGESLFIEERWVGTRLQNGLSANHPFQFESEGKVESKENPFFMSSCYDLFLKADELIRQDFELLTSKRASHAVGPACTIIGDPSQLFLEEGARITASIINLNDGPVYLGKNAEIMEGCAIRGPLALGEGCVVKMGAKLYGPSYFGPECRIGGEVSNSVMMGYSNKGHDGFLGNSVLGEWCNLGADTNTSNLKNNYSEVRTWSYTSESFESKGLVFCGLLMGDHSKCSINTMFNTGTVVGVSANIFGNGFPPKFIPSFSWGGSEKMSVFELEKAFDLAEKVCKRRGVTFSAKDRQILSEIFEFSRKFRI